MAADNNGKIITKKHVVKRIILKNNSGNYKTIFAANGILSFAEGLYYPFFIGFLYHLGGIPLLGAGLGLILIFGSVGSYFSGKLADKYSRKSLFLVSTIVSMVIFIAYPLLPLLGKIDHSLMLFTLFLIFIMMG